MLWWMIDVLRLILVSPSPLFGTSTIKSCVLVPWRIITQVVVVVEVAAVVEEEAGVKEEDAGEVAEMVADEVDITMKRDDRIFLVITIATITITTIIVDEVVPTISIGDETLVLLIIVAVIIPVEMLEVMTSVGGVVLTEIALVLVIMVVER